MKSYYVKEKEFKDFGDNLHKLIDVLNHRITKLEVHMSWVIKITLYIASILTVGIIKYLVV